MVTLLVVTETTLSKTPAGGSPSLKPPDQPRSDFVILRRRFKPKRGTLGPEHRQAKEPAAYFDLVWSSTERSTINLNASDDGNSNSSVCTPARYEYNISLLSRARIRFTSTSA